MAHPVLHHLREKLETLGTAMFTDGSEAEFTLPPCLIHDFVLPCEGFIQFRIQRPFQDLSEWNRHFYSTLMFYNKEYSFYIKLSGYAHLSNAGYELETDVRKGEGLVCFAMHIREVCHYETALPKGYPNRWQLLLKQVRQWLRLPRRQPGIDWKVTSVVS